MASQMRLRLTGREGGGSCLLLEEAGRMRYRVQIEGTAGGGVEVLLQGRSPHMEITQKLAKCVDFPGKWQEEGESLPLPCPLGWVRVLRAGELWLTGTAPGVLTPAEAAWQLLRTDAAGEIPLRPETDAPELMIPLPGVRFTREAGRWLARGADFTWEARPGGPEQDPFGREGRYLAGAAEGGWWFKEQERAYR